MQGYIYILSNPSTNLLKIGKTTRDPTVRVKELSSSTSAPYPFNLEYNILVDNCHILETQVHVKLSTRRTNPRREFFDVELNEAIDIIESLVLITNNIEDESEVVDNKLVVDNKSDEQFNALEYAKLKMRENSSIRILRFKKTFENAVIIYTHMRKLEKQPMINNKAYPPISFSLTKDKLSIHMSFYNFDHDSILGEADYNLGGLDTINEHMNKYQAIEMAKKGISLAANAFLVKKFTNTLFTPRYDPDKEFTDKDYKFSLSRYSEGEDDISGFVDIKPDMIDYINGISSIDYISSKHLGLHYDANDYIKISNNPNIKVSFLRKTMKLLGF